MESEELNDRGGRERGGSRREKGWDRKWALSLPNDCPCLSAHLDDRGIQTKESSSFMLKTPLLKKQSTGWWLHQRTSTLPLPLKPDAERPYYAKIHFIFILGMHWSLNGRKYKPKMIFGWKRKMAENIGCGVMLHLIFCCMNMHSTHVPLAYAHQRSNVRFFQEIST